MLDRIERRFCFVFLFPIQMLTPEEVVAQVPDTQQPPQQPQQTEEGAIVPVASSCGHVHKSVPYDDLLRRVQPLDLLLFRGTDAVSGTISRLQKCRLGDGQYTHVGIVVTHDLWPHPNLLPGQLYVWESTMSLSCCGLTDGVPDVEHNRGRFGVQIRDLRSVVTHYSGDVAWAPLLNNPFADTEMRSFVCEEFRKFQTQYGDATYDASFVELLSALLPFLRWIRNWSRCCRTCGGCRKETEWIFCSEGVAMIYQSIGVIEAKYTPRDVVPMDFLGRDEDGLPRLVGDVVPISLQ